MSVEIFEKYIGKLRIYDEQVECANKILDIFNRHGGPPILIAQMQQGKTGVCIAVIEQFIKFCKAKNKRYEIIYLINIADNVLKDQTDTRLLVSGLSENIKIIHHSGLNSGNFILNTNIDVRLIIIDECHIALGSSNNSALKPFHEFMKNCGTKYGESIATWKNQENYVLSVSATPYAQVIKAKIDKNAFEPVVLKINPNYYSIQHMKQDRRILQSKPIVKNGKITKFFEERFKEFLHLCEYNGNGHLVVRAIGKSPAIIKEYIQDNYIGVDIRIFESDPLNNIPQLDNILSQTLPNPFVAIIKGSLRAGKTLTTTKNIRMWIEPATSKADAMCQVVGRCLGFEMINGKNRKFEDTFPVYCNIKELNSAIDFYTDLKCVPSGNWSKATDTIVHDYEIAILKEQTKEEVRNNYSNITISCCSDGKANSYAKIILEKQLRGYGKKDGKVRIYYMDNPHQDHTADWDKLIQKYPNIQGKFVVVKPMPDKIIRKFDDALHSNGVLAQNIKDIMTTHN